VHNNVLSTTWKLYQFSETVGYYVGKYALIYWLKIWIIHMTMSFEQLASTILTLPQTGQRPPSLPLFAASCMLEVTSPCDPSRWRSRPWSVKKRNWHFWQFRGGLLYIILGWIFTLCIHCMWLRSCSKSCKFHI